MFPIMETKSLLGQMWKSIQSKSHLNVFLDLSSATKENVKKTMNPKSSSSIMLVFAHPLEGKIMLLLSFSIGNYI